jgi:Ca2+-transporting ATPase
MEQFDISTVSGLTQAEAEEKLRTEGLNEIPSSKKRSVLTMVAEVMREPMFLLLVACGSIYLFLGSPGDALMLLGFVFVVMAITVYQERKTERALEALRDLSSPRANVIRDGQQKRIAGRDAVTGDVLLLAEGDRVPADAQLIWCVNLTVDESLLTGESVPVRKMLCGESQSMPSQPGGDDLPYVYSGTLVVQGQGVARVYATGGRTELGKIGKALQEQDTEPTVLQKETRRLVQNLAVLGLALCALVVLVYGVTRGSWLQGLLAGITMAMAMLPEEFPVVLTIFLAMGAWRISRNQVLTRRMPAVENLGAATVLCVDKTGTLTLNQMRVKSLFGAGEHYDAREADPEPLPEALHELVEFSVLASQRDPFDPMEKAIKALGRKTLSSTEHMHDDWVLVREYPLSPALLALSHVWKSPDGTEYVIAAKGAPEAISNLCHLAESEVEALSQHIEAMAENGLRVLGVAKARFRLASLPAEQHDFAFEFLGLVGLVDPVREGVAEAIKECHSAGVRVIMITGDYAGTARYVAGQIGLAAEDRIITGSELDRLSDSELQDRIKTVTVFARVVPQQKLRLVEALKACGEIVAMTGDGVNDAPALKSAHIGIAMGSRGTDVARESSSLVLLDDNFTSIVKAVRMGRRVFDNLKKAMAYIFAVHVPIAGMSLIPVLFKWPLVFLPVHIVFMELIIDPACSFVFEAEPAESDVMNRSPRNPRERLFNSRMVGLSFLQGFSVLIILVAVYGIALLRGNGEADARALTFTTLIVANLGLILANRSWSRTIWATLRSPNVALWWVIGGAILFLGLVLYVPFLKDIFHFSTLHPFDLLICLAAGVVSIFWFEGLKVLRARGGPDFHRSETLQ